jgi:transcriptional regulator of acetoin/glycerol metabolism
MELEPAAFLALWLYGWPRNVRELEKVVREARLYAASDGRVGLAHLPQSMSGHVRSVPSPPPSSPTRSPDESDENGETGRKYPRPMPTKEELQSLLVQHKGSVSGVARALDRQWAVVHRTLIRHGLDPNEYRD